VAVLREHSLLRGSAILLCFFPLVLLLPWLLPMSCTGFAKAAQSQILEARSNNSFKPKPLRGSA
jgi:hypothetical protein